MSPLSEKSIWSQLGQSYKILHKNSASRLTKLLNKKGKLPPDESRKRPNQLILRAWNTVQHEYKQYEKELTKRVKDERKKEIQKGLGLANVPGMPGGLSADISSLLAPVEYDTAFPKTLRISLGELFWMAIDGKKAYLSKGGT